MFRSSNGGQEAIETLEPPPPLDWSVQTAEALMAHMGTGRSGLSTKEAAERLRRHGPNQLPERRSKLYVKFLVQFRNLFNLLLIMAALLSFVSGWISNDPGSYDVGAVILIIVLVSICFSILQERRAESTMQAIRELIPAEAKVIRDGRVTSIPVREVVPGDILELEEGDRVPADARLIEAYGLSVDNSPLTGESDAQPRNAALQPEAAAHSESSRSNLVLAGSTVLSGEGSALVLTTGTATLFGGIVRMAQTVQEPLSPLQLQLNRTARLYFVAAVGIGLLFLAVAALYLHLAAAESVLFMIGVIVSLVPEGFQVTVTLALALSSLSMAKRNVVVKRLSAVETLGSASVICVDKTGTITEGQMTARRAWLDGDMFEITGEGYDPSGSVLRNGAAVSAEADPRLQALALAAALCNTSALNPPSARARWTAVGDPTEAALLVFALKAGMETTELLKRMPRRRLIPFSSSRKMMSSVHLIEGGETAFVKGAAHEILARSSRFMLLDGEGQLDEAVRSKILAAADALASESFRVLAFAQRRLPLEDAALPPEEVEQELTFIGLMALLDPPRKEVPDAVRRANAAGLRVVMLTGDHGNTAAAIARQVGMLSPEGKVTTGLQLDEFDDEALAQALQGSSAVFARINAEQKLRIVRLLRARGEVVAVTGDGINDVPALLEGDIGIAMGRSGTDAARESADMVLLDDNFASIVASIEQGRGVYDNLKKFLVYDFTHNWAELAAFLAFVLLQTPLPLAVVQVLAIDLLLEIPPSLSLSMDQPDDRDHGEEAASP